MTIGPPKKVLTEVATVIGQVESGDITLTWHTAHGHRVVESSPTTVHIGSAAPAEPEAAPATPQQPVKTQPPTDARARVEATGRALGRWTVDAWRTVFPPKGQS